MKYHENWTTQKFSILRYLYEIVSVFSVAHLNGESKMTDYPVVLTEFSSIVTDTQQYIMPDPESTNDTLGQHETEQV